MQRHTVVTETSATSGTLLHHPHSFQHWQGDENNANHFLHPSDVTAMSSKANFKDLDETAGHKMAGLEYNRHK